MLLPRLPFLWWVGRVKLPIEPDPPSGVSLPSDDPKLSLPMVMPSLLMVSSSSIFHDNVVDENCVVCR